MALPLKNRKVKYFQPQAPAEIWVWQDSNAADADATHKYDNAIITGAPGRSTLMADREYFEMISMESHYETGRVFTGRLIGRRAWFNDPAGSMVVEPNGRLEIYADVPTQFTVSPAMPSWHLNSLAPGQVRIFYGHVRSVKCTPTGLQFEARDPRWRANVIKLHRDAQNAITLPKIAFNLPADNPDHVYNCIKNVDGSDALGTGTSNQADSRATLGQILKYLRQHYNAALIAQEVLDPAYSGQLFTDTDLDLLTWKPDAIVLEGVGFFEGVKRILADWAPHLKIIVDPRTTQWRLIQYGPTITDAFATAGTVIEQNYPTHLPYGSAAGPCSTTAIFSATPGTDGNRVRIYAANYPSLNEERTVHSIVGTDVRFVEVGQRSYPAGAIGGAKLYPIRSDALPTLQLNLDDTPADGIDIDLDLDDVWTAVNIYSVYTKTAASSDTWTPGSPGASHGLNKGWDAGFESAWTDKDKDRFCDFGPPGQVGMKPYAIGNDGVNDYLLISFNQSQYGSNHVSNEWKDTAVWVWSQDGANTRNAKVNFRIKNQGTVSDVGDGTPGLKLTLEAGVGGFLSLAPNFKTISDPSSNEDVVVISMDYGLLDQVHGNNKRWEVGRMWYFADTTIQFDGSSSPHVTVCSPAKVMSDNGTESPRRVIGMSPGLGYPQRNSRTTGPWEVLATGGLGATHVWRRSTYTHTPTGSPCPNGGWKAPKIVQMDFETTTTVMRNARYPSAPGSYGGVAFARYNHQAEWTQVTNQWVEESQTADFESLAQKLFFKKSHAHHHGTIKKPGIRENAVWLDLCCNVSMHATQSAAIYGGPIGGSGGAPSVSMVEGFWGALTSVTLEFGSGKVIFGFDNQAAIQELAFEVYEKLGIKVAGLASDLSSAQAKYNEAIKCLQGSQTGETPAGMCGASVYAPDGKNILVKINGGGKTQNPLMGGAGSAGDAY